MKIDEDFISDRREALAQLERCEALKDTCFKMRDLLEMGGSSALQIIIMNEKTDRQEYHIKKNTDLTRLTSEALPVILRALNEEVIALKHRQKELLTKYFPLQPGESINE